MTEIENYEKYIAELSKSELEGIIREIDQIAFPEKYQIVKLRLQAFENDSNGKNGNKIELKILGVFLGFVFVILSVVFFPIAGWFIVLLFGRLVELIGFSIDMVGTPAGYSIGAILTSILYITLGLFIALISAALHQRYIASTIAIMCILVSPIIYFLVKNIMWL